jgi:hypothetical protein
MHFLFLAESYNIHSAEASHICPPFSPETVEPLKVKFQKCNREEIDRNGESVGNYMYLSVTKLF